MKSAGPPPGRERGNVILLTLVIIMSLTALGLGLHTLLRSRVSQEIILRSIGDVPPQVLYVAEVGVNQLIFSLNSEAIAIKDCSTDSGATSHCYGGNVYDPLSLLSPVTNISKCNFPAVVFHQD